MQAFVMPKVAVVGAGVAGLVCAKEIEGNGIDVDVFEANDRVGGRRSFKNLIDYDHLYLAYPSTLHGLQ